MILDIPPSTAQIIQAVADKQGISINELLLNAINTPAPKSIADLVKGKRLEGFNDDPVAIQRALRDD